MSLELFEAFTRPHFVKRVAAILGGVFAGEALAEPMTISISITDSDGLNLQGTVQVIVTASPLTNLSRVELYVDGNLYGTDTATPYTFNWDTTKVGDGSHTLKAIAYYKTRKSQAQMAVTVKNVVAPPPPSDFPASYFTGPLGANNIVPTSSTGALLSLWFDDGGLTTTQKRAAIQQRMTDCGRAFDCLGIHYGGIETPGNGSNLGTGSETWVHQQGSIPLVSWVPNRLTKGTSNLNTMQEINNGLHDAKFQTAANYLGGLGFRVMLRMFWEFDGNWFPWSPTAANSNDGFPNPGCTSTEWISAWRRIVGIFQSAPKVGFWWCPTEGFNRTLAGQCYPGDVFVDWVGSDAYNQASSTVQTSPLHAGWAEFWELFNYTGHGTATVCKHDEFGPSKPFVVGETSSLYDSGTPSRKAQWFRNIQDHVNGKPDMPYLCGVEIFDANLSSSEGFDWRVDRNQTYAQKQAHTPGNVDAVTYQGFKDWAATPTWNVGAVGGAT